MKRLSQVTVVLAALAVLAPAGALAKGASEATIVGPGLDAPISIVNDTGELTKIAESAGFFPAVFARIPDPMLDERPAGDLGPKFTITYVMPGPGGEVSRIGQDVYPYASPAPVSYVEPGQPFWTTDRTRGGWYVGFSDLKDRLVAAGLPESPPAATPPSDSPWKVVGPVGVVVVLGILGGLAALLLRRRPQTA